jgi:hypothetical protein
MPTNDYKNELKILTFFVVRKTVWKDRLTTIIQPSPVIVGIEK